MQSQVYPEIPEYIRNLVPYVPGKPIEETQRELKLKRVIKLASNENPLGPSPKALRAIQKALKQLNRYPDASGYRLKHALGKHLKLDPREIVLGNGSNDVIDLLIRSYCIPGDAIVTAQAAFVAYRICAQIQGVRALEAQQTADLRFDLRAMLQLIREDPRARMAFVANPNNPTGTYVSERELREFLEGVGEIAGTRGREILVVIDSAYAEFVTARDLPDPLKLRKEFPGLIVLRTFSKVYGLGGLRVGYGVADAGIVATLDKVRQPFNLNSLGLAGAEAALGDRAFVARALKANREGMRFWERELARMKIPFWPSQGNFLLVDVMRGMGRPGTDVYLDCLKQGVIFRPVANYGLPHALRISIGTMAENRVAARVLADVQANTMPNGKATRKCRR